MGAIAVQFLSLGTGEIDKLLEIDQLCNPAPWPLEQFRIALSLPDVQARSVIDSEFRLAGFIIGRQIDHGSVEFGDLYRTIRIDNLAVHPSCWRQRFGAALVEDRTRYARERGFDAMTATVRSTNEAGDFFRAMGFKAQRIIRFESAPSAVRYVLRLTDRPCNLD